MKGETVGILMVAALVIWLMVPGWVRALIIIGALGLEGYYIYERYINKNERTTSNK